LFTARSPAEQEEYAVWLAGAASRDDVTVVVVVRSDYYAQAAVTPGVSDLLAANTVLVGEMTSDELRQAVELPAAAAGLELQPGLAETISGDVVGEPGGLPLMSTALLSLWERRDGRRLTLAAYHELGGVRTAVARLAESAYGQLTPSQQSVARRTLLRLADTGEAGEPVRRQVPIAEVAPDGDADARAVLDTLAARRLITVSDIHAEVAHEALLREWPRLLTWLDEDEAGRKLRRHLAPAAIGWQASREVGELYRGSRLTGALDWQRDHPDDLTQVEHDFLRASQEVAEADALRRRRSVRRLRVLAVGLAGVLMLALLAGAFAFDQRNESADRRREAVAAALRADVRALHGRALNENRLDRALLYAAQAQRFEPSDDSRGALLQAVQRSPEATAILYADQALETVAASADGTTVAASGFEGTLYVWDAESRQRMTIPDVAIFVESLDISSDGRYVAVVGVPVANLEPGPPFDNQVVLVDLEQPPSVGVLDDDEVSSAMFAADGRTIVTVGEDGLIRYVDVQTRVVQRTLDFELAGFETALVDATGDRRFMLIAAEPESSGPALVFDVESGAMVYSSFEPEETIASISPDGSTLVLGHADGQIEQVDLTARGQRTPIPASLEDGLVDVAFAPNGSMLAGVTQERTILVWDAKTLETEAVLRGHSGRITDAAFSPDSSTIYASGEDLSVLAWDLTGERGIVTNAGGRSGPGVERTAIAPDGSVAATRYSDGRVNVFDLARNQTFDVEIHGEVDWLSVDRFGRYVEVVTNHQGSSTVYVIDVQRQALQPHTFTLERETAYAAEFTWDGQRLVTAAQDRIDVWDLATGENLSPSIYRAADEVPALAVDPTGRFAALGEGGGSIEVIDLETGELIETLDPDFDQRFAVVPAFSPDGRWLAARYISGRVVWDTRSWQMYRAWEAVENFGDPIFTSDSRLLVAGGAGTASIRSVEQGASGDTILEADPQGLEDVAVGASDGSTIVSFTEGTGVRIWNIAPERLLEHACMVAGRNLTHQEWDDVLPDRPYERTCPEYPDG
jgi:WD40 repeat protein